MKSTATTSRRLLEYLAAQPDGATLRQIDEAIGSPVRMDALASYMTKQIQLGRVKSNKKKPSIYTITEQGRKQI